jgi:hypothetical protein
MLCRTPRLSPRLSRERIQHFVQVLPAAAATAAATTTTTAAATTTTTAAAAATAATALALLGLVDAERTAVELRAVELRDGRASLFRRPHRHESKAARLAGLAVLDDVDVRDFAALCKCLAQRLSRSLKGQIAYV